MAGELVLSCKKLINLRSMHFIQLMVDYDDRRLTYPTTLLGTDSATIFLKNWCIDAIGQEGNFSWRFIEQDLITLGGFEFFDVNHALLFVLTFNDKRLHYDEANEDVSFVH